ncbi:hypothetical protein WNY51_02615 [Pseudocolwellia sp. AS88]|uniref:hypothetical protein n=1 Tax=Pseudocolwellia sp. AS88 TaxID=3063958 RepID=UPI0026ED77D2|nr:hypothetical protein [Pseudocolwellia sp. AS88]MDO7084484.1 hypothetical protein [Pseudocolwellia sp. AS88]
MPVDQVLLLLLNSLSLKNHKLVLSWFSVNLWEDQAFSLMLDNKLITPVSKAKSIQCRYCEKNCTLDVIPHSYPNKTIYYAICDDPIMNEQVGRMTIPPEQLNQWKISIKQLAVSIADLLGLPCDISYNADQRSIVLGALKSKTAGRKSVLLNVEPLSLLINQSELLINEVLYFENNKLALDKEQIDHALNLKQLSSVKPYRANTDKKEQRKANTQAMYQDWQEQALKLHKLNPTKSKTWLSQQIAKMAIAKGKSPETIRRNINI